MIVNFEIESIWNDMSKCGGLKKDKVYRTGTLPTNMRHFLEYFIAIMQRSTIMYYSLLIISRAYRLQRRRGHVTPTEITKFKPAVEQYYL